MVLYDLAPAEPISSMRTYIYHNTKDNFINQLK
jgi:hypothetical protein